MTTPDDLVERLTRERDEALAAWDKSSHAVDQWRAKALAAEAEIERMIPRYVAYDYLESPARADIAEAKVAELRKALERQCDNMAFVVNHASLGTWYDKFKDELEADRKALKADRDELTREGSP